MPDITVAATIAVASGPRLPINCTLSVEAYDEIEVTIPAGAADLPVEIQPGGPGQVQFVAIVAQPPDAALVYRVNSAATPARALDQPHLFAGAGAISFLDPAAPAKLLFTNGTAGPAARDFAVQILVGRKATA